jgi:hypothetical protein
MLVSFLWAAFVRDRIGTRGSPVFTHYLRGRVGDTPIHNMGPWSSSICSRVVRSPNAELRRSVQIAPIEQEPPPTSTRPLVWEIGRYTFPLRNKLFYPGIRPAFWNGRLVRKIQSSPWSSFCDMFLRSCFEHSLGDRHGRLTEKVIADVPNVEKRPGRVVQSNRQRKL